MILRLVGEREHLIEVGLAGRRTAEEKANWKKNFQKLLEAYELAFTLAHSPRAPAGRAPEDRVPDGSSGA